MKNKKIFRVSMVSIAFMIPILGRAIGQMRIDSQYPSPEENETFMKEQGSILTYRMEVEYEEYKEYFGTFKMDFSDKNNVRLLDEQGNMILSSILELEYVHTSFFMFHNFFGYYVLNTEQSDVTGPYTKAYKVLVKEEGEEERYAILYTPTEDNNLWNIQTKETLYENIKKDNGSISSTTKINISNGIPEFEE